MIHRITTITYPYTLIKTRIYMMNTRFEFNKALISTHIASGVESTR